MAGAKQHDQLKGEVYHCMDEMILLSFLLKDELNGSGVIVTGLVVYSGKNAHNQTGCIDCDNFVVSSKIFSSVHHFDNFWKTFVSLFEAVASKIVGYLTHLQFKISEKSVLPVPEKEPAGNIKQNELLLDRYQMEIAYSDEKRIFSQWQLWYGQDCCCTQKTRIAL